MRRRMLRNRKKRQKLIFWRVPRFQNLSGKWPEFQDIFSTKILKIYELANICVRITISFVIRLIMWARTNGISICVLLGDGNIYSNRLSIAFRSRSSTLSGIIPTNERINLWGFRVFTTCGNLARNIVDQAAKNGRGDSRVWNLLNSIVMHFREYLLPK